VKESKIFEGRWWIFGTEKPEHFGVLHYSPEKGLRLEVKIAQSFGIAQILQETNRTDFPDVIQGRDKDDKPISLFCSSRPSWNKSGGLASYEFHPLIAIVGHSVESWSAANYQKVDIRLSLLHSWMGQSRVEQKLTSEHVHQIQIVPKPAVEIKLGNAVTLKINSRFHTNPQSGSFEINEEHYISLEFPQPVHAKSILTDYAEKLRRLFSVLTGTPVVLESVHFDVPDSGEHPDLSELLQRNEATSRAKRDIIASRMTAPYKELAEILPTVVAKWFEYHEQLDAVLNLYFAVLFNPSLYINHRFLFLAQALEVYHNSHIEFVGYVQPKADFRERRDRIVQAVPPEEKEWLEEKLHYANQKTLAQRLAEILAKNKSEAEQFISDLQRFADAVKNTRNYHTHFDDELKEKGKVTDDMEALVRLASQMETLLGVCILKDLGITGVPITRIIDRYKMMEIFSLK
jgi:hypothetical protein